LNEKVKIMQMHAIKTEAGEDWAGPYTDKTLLEKTISIIQQVDESAEIVTMETDPFKDQIMSGLRPYRIDVDLVDGMPQLPVSVSLTWPPAEIEGLQEGTKEHRIYFVWAKNERDAVANIGRSNKR
jgi:hypothetical protein